MPEYYLDILANSNRYNKSGEATFLYNQLLSVFRNNYKDSYEDFEADLVDQLIDGNLMGTSTGTIGKLRSPYQSPNYTVTSAFGPRNIHGLQWHNGIDLSIGGGATCVAVADGLVLAAIHQGSLTRVIIEHAFLPSTGKKGYTVYLHMSNFQVSTGQKVRAGQALGTESDQGSGGSIHLHFEVRDEKQYALDPALHLDLSDKNKTLDRDLKAKWKSLISASDYKAVAPSANVYSS